MTKIAAITPALKWPLVLASALLIGCVAINSNGEPGSSSPNSLGFTDYKAGESPERYCEAPRRRLADQTSAECVHQLVVFDRARRACASSAGSLNRRCVSRNQQRWNEEVASAKALVLQLAGSDFNALNFHQQMRRQAEQFVILCQENSDEPAACSDE